MKDRIFRFDNNYFIVLNSSWLELQKGEIQSSAKVVRHLKFDPALKIAATFYGSLM